MILTGAAFLVAGLLALAVGLYYRQRAQVRLTPPELLEVDDTAEGYAMLIFNPHTGQEWRIYADGGIEGFEAESAVVVINKIPALLDAAGALGYSEAESLAGSSGISRLILDMSEACAVERVAFDTVYLPAPALRVLGAAIERDIGSDQPCPVSGADQRINRSPERGLMFNGINFLPIKAAESLDIPPMTPEQQKNLARAWLQADLDKYGARTDNGRQQEG